MSVTTNPNKNKRGRPELSDDDERGYVYKVGLNKAEVFKFYDRLIRAGVQNEAKQRAKFMRKLMLGEPINSAPLVNKIAVAEINRIGVNLNQLIRTGKLNNEILLSMKAEQSVAIGKLLGVEDEK